MPIVQIKSEPAGSREMAEQIKTLFDPSRNIHRTIEKVITYSASQQNRLKDELAEYHVTASIDSHF